MTELSFAEFEATLPTTYSAKAKLAKAQSVVPTLEITLIQKRATERHLRKKAHRKATRERQKAKACKHVAGIGLLAEDPCAYCGAANPTTHDHIDPISRGGMHEFDNLTRCCWFCNRDKASFLLLIFLARRALRKAA